MAETIVAWLRERPSATVNDIVASGLMSSRSASDAVQYAVRCGALARDVRRGASVKDRVQYRTTGIALPAVRLRGAEPCFDGLLQAWGIVLNPPQLRAGESRRHQIADYE
ncbi:hypothetical protein C7402_103135 [Paraburkholderia unamae]|uniref:Uncharacterized protein n=2 Tax=Paraburkholderia unamae TaxID=219649 RepID=A0ABX5KRQ1_9BURK|nr:hypothetical protein C7402_103135 [Paraburkholderia unamae]RAR55233.1 hypothetical protein C7401_1228 [Paraburkholderia unamae]